MTRRRTDVGVVRAATIADLDNLGLLWLDFMQVHADADPRFRLAADAPSHWRGMVEDLLAREDAFVFVAQAAPTNALGPDPLGLLGFCLGWVVRNPPIYNDLDVGFVSEVAVRPAVRRRGIGTSLVEHARRWCIVRGLKQLQLATAAWNEAALAFWGNLGGKPLLVRYSFDTALPVGRTHPSLGVEIRPRSRPDFASLESIPPSAHQPPPRAPVAGEPS